MRRKASPSSRRLTILAVAVALAGGVAFQRYAAALERESRPGGEPVEVAVAAGDLPRGHALRADDLETARIPTGFVPPNALVDPSEALGRVLAAAIAAGEILTESRLAPRAGPVAALVPPGLRAVAVATALPAGTVAPGDRVDVLSTFATGAPYTETIVSDAEVLTVLSGTPGGLDEASLTLVLLVSPDDAERLAYARAFGDLSVAIAPGG